MSDDLPFHLGRARRPTGYLTAGGGLDEGGYGWHMASWKCRILGHRIAFEADGSTMRWHCERGCGEGGGAKTYATPEQARRYAAAFDKRDSDHVVERAPVITLLPLRLLRRFSRGPK